MNSRRTFLASLVAAIPVMGSTASAGWFKAPKTSKIIFTNATGLAVPMLISTTTTATLTTPAVNSGNSLVSSATPGSATILSATTTVPDPVDPLNPPITISANLAVKYPILPNASCTYNLNFDGVSVLTIVKA